MEWTPDTGSTRNRSAEVTDAIDDLARRGAPTAVDQAIVEPPDAGDRTVAFVGMPAITSSRLLRDMAAVMRKLAAMRGATEFTCKTRMEA